MRIRLNGPNIIQFDPLPYKKIWFDEQHLSSETELGARKELDELSVYEPLMLEPIMMPENVEDFDEDGFPILEARDVSFKDPERAVLANIFA